MEKMLLRCVCTMAAWIWFSVVELKVRPPASAMSLCAWWQVRALASGAGAEAGQPNKPT
jgi:hypothetical protein